MRWGLEGIEAIVDRGSGTWARSSPIESNFAPTIDGTCFTVLKARGATFCAV